jgi:hypothetical protein
MTLSARDKMIVALAPALLVLGVYFWNYAPR